MSGDCDAKRAQLFNETPNLGAAGVNFFRQLGAAHDQHCVVGQHTYDAGHAHVAGRSVIMRLQTPCAGIGLREHIHA
jgi:hypothetical protein